jgi:hypothetical protein
MSVKSGAETPSHSGLREGGAEPGVGGAFGPRLLERE